MFYTTVCWDSYWDFFLGEAIGGLIGDPFGGVVDCVNDEADDSVYVADDCVDDKADSLYMAAAQSDKRHCCRSCVCNAAGPRTAVTVSHRQIRE